MPARKRLTIPALPPPSPLPICRSLIATSSAVPSVRSAGRLGLCALISLISAATSPSTATRFCTTLPFHCRLSLPSGSPQTLNSTGSTTSNRSGFSPHTLRMVDQSGAFSAGSASVVIVPCLPSHATPGSQPSACLRSGRLAASISCCTCRISSSPSAI